jgi:hypothetical protein
MEEEEKNASNKISGSRGIRHAENFYGAAQ